VRPRWYASALALALGLVAFAAPRTARAAACCLSSSAFGNGRLAPWEHSAISLGISTSPVLGRWDAAGGFRSNDPDFAENEWRLQLSALIALHQRLQLSGRVPVVLTVREAQGERAAGGGLGDSQLGLRFEPIFQGEYPFLPELALNVGLTLPSGRLADGSAPASQLGTEVTGRGAWVLSAAATVELARAFWFVQASGGVTVPLPMTTAGGREQMFGVGAQAQLAGGVEPFKNFVVSLLVRFAYEGPLRVEPVDPDSGEPTGAPMVLVPGSHAYDFGLGPNLSYKLNGHWTLQGGADFNLPIGGLGANRQVRIGANLGVRFAYF
jgi:hypothetical protein